MDNICCCIENEIRCNKQSEPNKTILSKTFNVVSFHPMKTQLIVSKIGCKCTSILMQNHCLNSNPLFRQMFGHGIYFADLAYKSLNYSNNIRNRCVEFYSQPPTYNGWLLLSSMTVSGPITVDSCQGYTESLSNCYEMTLQESG